VNERDPVERALQLARGELSAPEAALERVWQRVTPDAVAPAAPRGWAALKATGASGVVAAAVLAGGGFALGFLARGESPVQHSEVALPAPPVAVPVPPPASASAAAPSSAVPQAVVVDAGVEATPRASARPPARRATKPSSGGAQQELVLLQRVERALRNEDGALALVLLAELEQKFPKSSLLEERAAARLMSHCVQKERGAPEAAQAFLKAHPASVYQSRLRSLCKIGAGESAAPITEPSAPDTDGP
jgi:hypothetical protein